MIRNCQIKNHFWKVTERNSQIFSKRSVGKFSSSNFKNLTIRLYTLKEQRPESSHFERCSDWKFKFKFPQTIPKLWNSFWNFIFELVVKLWSSESELWVRSPNFGQTNYTAISIFIYLELFSREWVNCPVSLPNRVVSDHSRVGFNFKVFKRFQLESSKSNSFTSQRLATNCGMPENAS